MSLSTADLPAPIAVLVLAWGEASPAVRALVAATQASVPTVDSILVMVPQADAPNHLSAEEYLPLPTLPDCPAPPTEPLAAENYPPATAEATASNATPLPAATTGAPAAAILSSVPELARPRAETTTSTSPQTTPAPPTWAAVRVLRLASHSLPQLARQAGQPFPAPIWTGAAQPPAAPYLGATLLATAPPAASPAPKPVASSTAETASEDEPTHIAAPAPAPVPPAPAGALVAAALASTPAAPAYEPAEALPQGTLETDLPLAEGEANELEEAPSRDLFQEADFSLDAAQAGWPEALAALRHPAPLAAPSVVEPTPSPLPAPHKEANTPTPAPASPAPSALRPAAAHYPAPDLNYQVIQYARFAVPVALAEASFAAIYAPAWPTWLAAQELRQRTGRPLVLHVATLAANAGESVATATGWMADLQRQALQRADLILTETPALAERLRRELGLPFATVQAVAAADALAIAQALHTARPRPVADRS